MPTMTCSGTAIAVSMRRGRQCRADTQVCPYKLALSCANGRDKSRGYPATVSSATLGERAGGWGRLFCGAEVFEFDLEAALAVPAVDLQRCGDIDAACVDQLRGAVRHPEPDRLGRSAG